MNSVKDFRGKIEPPVEKGVLKIERYAQRLTQGYSARGGSYLWAPAVRRKKTKILTFNRKRHYPIETLLKGTVSCDLIETPAGLKCFRKIIGNET